MTTICVRSSQFIQEIHRQVHRISFSPHSDCIRNILSYLKNKPAYQSWFNIVLSSFVKGRFENENIPNTI